MGMLDDGTEGMALDEGAGITEDDGTDEGIDQLGVEDGCGMYELDTGTEDTGTEGMEDQLLGVREAEEDSELHWELSARRHHQLMKNRDIDILHC